MTFTKAEYNKKLRDYRQHNTTAALFVQISGNGIQPVSTPGWELPKSLTDGLYQVTVIDQRKDESLEVFTGMVQIGSNPSELLTTGDTSLELTGNSERQFDAMVRLEEIRYNRDRAEREERDAQRKHEREIELERLRLEYAERKEERAHERELRAIEAQERISEATLKSNELLEAQKSLHEKEKEVMRLQMQGTPPAISHELQNAIVGTLAPVVGNLLQISTIAIANKFKVPLQTQQEQPAGRQPQ